MWSRPFLKLLQKNAPHTVLDYLKSAQCLGQCFKVKSSIQIYFIQSIKQQIDFNNY